MIPHLHPSFYYCKYTTFFLGCFYTLITILLQVHEFWIWAGWMLHKAGKVSLLGEASSCDIPLIDSPVLYLFYLQSIFLECGWAELYTIFQRRSLQCCSTICQLGSTLPNMYILLPFSQLMSTLEFAAETLTFSKCINCIILHVELLNFIWSLKVKFLNDLPGLESNADVTFSKCKF